MIPKFRAWVKPGVLSNHPDGVVADAKPDFLGMECLVKRDDLKGKKCFTEIFDFEDVELMQSTGLKGYMNDKYEDDQEKDVYKGDIIDIFWEEWPMGYYQENHMIGVVDKDETGMAWIIKNAKYEFDTPKPIPSEIDGISVSMSLPDDEDLEEIFLHNFNLTSDDVTILGNIYENPELLEAIE